MKNTNPKTYGLFVRVGSSRSAAGLAFESAMAPELLLCADFQLSLVFRHPIYISIIRAVKKAMMEARKKNTARIPLAASPSSGCGIRESRKSLILKPRARAAGRNLNTRRQALRLPNKLQRKTAIFI